MSSGSNLFIGLALGFGAAAVATALFGNSQNSKMVEYAHDRVDELEEHQENHCKSIDFLMDWYKELNEDDDDLPPNPGDEIPDDDDDVVPDAVANKSVSGPIPFRPKKAS